MKKLLLLAALVAFVTRLAAADPAADADFAVLQTLAHGTPPWIEPDGAGGFRTVRRAPLSESMLWSSRKADQVALAALKFMADHPADPRRWNAAAIALTANRTFMTDIRAGFDAAVAAQDHVKAQGLVVRDAAAQAAWQEQARKLFDAVLAAPDASTEAVATVLHQACYQSAMNRAAKPEQRLADLRGYLATFERRAPDSPKLASAYRFLFGALERADPAAYVQLLQDLKPSANPAVASLVAGLLTVQAAKDVGVEMKFTAVDGREVDLAKLRGKVVLIDFWATWCGPCKAELPNVKAVYDKYHDRGFEVVAISLDKAADKQKLIDYCREHALPWPQFFDGKFWQNEFAVKYAVKAIPAMFLLDQQGKVVSTNARGPLLEAEVKRRLGL